MSYNKFSFNAESLSDIAQQLIKLSKTGGATDAEVEVCEGNGLTVTVRLGEIETLEYHQDKSLGITVYCGQQKGHASSSDFSPQALSDTVNAALDIAKLTVPDPFAGLADPAILAQSTRDLDLFHPLALEVDQAIVLAKACEAAGQAVSEKIVNSDGATLSTEANQFIYANSLGFCSGYPATRHRMSVSFVAQQDDAMQCDHWLEVSRDATSLESVAAIGKKAGERTVRRLGARQIKTGEYPVLFASPISASLVAWLVEALSGHKLYRKSSFLLDSLGHCIFPDWVRLEEDPFILKGLGSCPFDSEGATVNKRAVIQKGEVAGYFLDSYSARRLGMKSTGNAGGSHNLILQHSHKTFDDLLRTMQRGIVVTELMGNGINLVTGDYSQGAVGFWVEQGEIAYPIEEITIAGNLMDMFKRVVAVADDAVVWGSKRVGSILIESMIIAGQ